MKSMHSLTALGCLVALSACGGGGGSGSTSTPVQTSSLTTITAANAPKAASNGYAAGNAINQSSSSLTGVVTGVTVAPAGVSVASPAFDLVKRAVRQNGASLLTGVTMSSACTGGGSMTIDATLHNQNTLTNGDTLAVTTKNCVEEGSTMNGAVSVTVSGVSGDVVNGTTGAVTLDMRLTGFSVTTGSDTEVGTGDMKISVNATSATDLDLTISGNSLQVTEQHAGTTVATRTLTAYTMTGGLHGTTVTAAANFAVSGNANGLGQFAYTVQSLQPLVTTTMSDVPTAGSFIVNGAASSVTATIVPTGVRLDYSAKGDGVITQTSTVSWTSFVGA
jgi:hypothetical protein